MNNLWLANEIESLFQISLPNHWECVGVSIDTRTLIPGDLFIALEGDNGDGHSYLDLAAEKGAVAAIVQKNKIKKAPVNFSLINVSNTLEALQVLAVSARERCSAKRIAVTGSVGKTSTKEMLRLALSCQGLTHASVASYNNHWGVPLTLARMPRETKFGVFEVGMNHSGEITPLSQMIAPHVAVITHVAESHAAFFHSLDDIAEAKAEIFAGLSEGGVAVLNQDNSYFSKLSQAARLKGASKVIGFGKNNDADVRLVAVEKTLAGNNIKATVCGKTVSYTLEILGDHWILNSLAVLATINAIGADVNKAALSLKSMLPPSGRGKIYPIKFEKGNFTLIDESYNANPVSMVAAFNVLGQYKDHRKIAVIGDMRELGEISEARHLSLKDVLCQNNIDLVFCCGTYMQSLYETLPKSMQGGYTLHSHDLISSIIGEIENNDVVTVKGSLGTRMKPIVDALLALNQS